MLLLGLLLTTGCGDDTCVEGGRTYSDSHTWTCSDGCNICQCAEGKAMGTLMNCSPEDASNVAAGRLRCEDDDGSHAHGDTWSCPNASGTCVCIDGTVEQK